MKKIHLLLLLIFIGTSSYAQNLGLILKGSTTGVGVDLAYRISPKWLVKVVTDSYPYKFLTNFKSADCNGSDGYNEKLSLRRAMSLSKVVRKISKNQTIIYNVGERQLVADCVVGQDKDGQVINRYSYMFIINK